jgi:hypothetical protein
MIDHSNHCLILEDGFCTCGGDREPKWIPGPARLAEIRIHTKPEQVIFGITPPSVYEVGQHIAYDTLGRDVCSGTYHCTAQEHTEGCYSQDVCRDPECPAEGPHISHRPEPWKP